MSPTQKQAHEKTRRELARLRKAVQDVAIALAEAPIHAADVARSVEDAGADKDNAMRTVRARAALSSIVLTMAAKLIRASGERALADQVLRDLGTTMQVADAQLYGETCRGCGCTNARACEGGCSWVEIDLCSQCVEGAPS